jgi:hypothetical protein
MIVYLTYMNWFYLIRQEEGMIPFNYCFIAILAFFCQYFFVLEMKQLNKNGYAKYLSSIWNYLDLIPPITLAIFLPLELFGSFNYQLEVEEYTAK